MMGGAHMMGWEQQLWTHTSMVMVGTSNHSDAVMCSSSAVTITVIIAIDCTAAINRPTPAPIWREEDIAHVSRSDEEEVHEAVEPTTMTMMTSDEGERGDLDVYVCVSCFFRLSSISSSTSSSSSFVSSSFDRGCGGEMNGGGCGGDGVMCVDVPLPHMTMTMMVVSGRWPFSSQALMTRAGRYTHTQLCERRRHKMRRWLCVCVCVIETAANTGRQTSCCRCWGWWCCDDGRACACAVQRVWGCTDEDKEGHGSCPPLFPFISSFCSISDDDGGRGM
ncbi:hypothetical protein PTSG_10938 [Salpingoeca rosetta]|uniref:Uncharacterized protein n=1 Tax=Salpingoeca rosetta (strain ATCC 50818 / BSB-021) TaxID=946362 RepID=F2URG1_SALR5|nr:uncharacterized protein PTSG_10938 [Salpingoeca rosetta]EGD80264.1 hypothetical protein PTSG_10938 [Salpingoeca rosetta]|eukprot:XP_004988326.1 hypothetical protein PTSG_10938 [Salpingoeca rosetta]